MPEPRPPYRAMYWYVPRGCENTGTSLGGKARVAVVTSLSDYQELADLMGDTAEQVASLRDAADLSGTAMDRVAAASVKLTSTLSAGGNVTKEMGSALKKIE